MVIIRFVNTLMKINAIIKIETKKKHKKKSIEIMVENADII